MWNVFLRSLKVARCLTPVLGTVFLAAASTAVSAQTTPLTPLDRQLQRIDFSVNGVGEFTKSVSGTNYQSVSFTQKPSNTLGALVTVRYTVKPLIGFELNYGYVRYTENFTNYSPLAPTATGNYLPGGAQTKGAEYSVGYVAHGPNLLGYRSFGSVGVGALSFVPTTFGGQGLPSQVRPVYYYDVGLEGSVLGSEHFGLRAQLRQQFFGAPDFGQNYLTIRKNTFTTEPGIGFYVRF